MPVEYLIRIRLSKIVIRGSRWLLLGDLDLLTCYYMLKDYRHLKDFRKLPQEILIESYLCFNTPYVLNCLYLRLRQRGIRYSQRLLAILFNCRLQKSWIRFWPCKLFYTMLIVICLFPTKLEFSSIRILLGPTYFNKKNN